MWKCLYETSQVACWAQDNFQHQAVSLGLEWTIYHESTRRECDQNEVPNALYIYVYL